MTCKNTDIKELFPLYLEQALERSEQERVEQHLGTCEDCRRELSLLRAMAGEPVPDPGEAFWGQMPSRVYREVRERQHKPRRPGLSALWQNLLMPRWAWATAAVMIVSVLSWMLLRPVHKDASVAVVPEDESPYAEVLADESLDVATLASDEFESMGVWAEKELAAMTADAGEVMANGSDTDIYEELVDMDGRALNRFSTMIDSLKREG